MNYKGKKRISKLLKILIFLLIISIICFIIVFVYGKKENNKSNEKLGFDGEKYSVTTKEYLKNKVLPRNIYDFSKEYLGKIDRNEFYEKFYDISEYLPDLCNDLENINIQTYYSKYANKIKDYLGIQDEMQFKKFAQYLIENNVKNLNFEYCSYYPESMKFDGMYSNFRMDFKYENSNFVTLNIGILNRKSGDSPILKVIVD